MVAFDVPSNAYGAALRADFHTLSQRWFPGFPHLGVTVYAAQ